MSVSAFFGVWVYVVTGPVRYGQIDVRVRARSARGVRDLDIIWTHFGGVDTSVFIRVDNIPEICRPHCLGWTDIKIISRRTCMSPHHPRGRPT